MKATIGRQKRDGGRYSEEVVWPLQKPHR